MKYHSTNSWFKNIETSKSNQNSQKSAKNNKHAYIKEACWEIYKKLFKMRNDENQSSRSNRKVSIIEIIKAFISKHCVKFHHKTFKVKKLYNKSHIRYDYDNCRWIHETCKIHIMQNHDDNKTINVFAIANNIFRKWNFKKDSFEQRQIVHIQIHEKINSNFWNKTNNVHVFSLTNERTNKTNESNIECQKRIKINHMSVNKLE